MEGTPRPWAGKGHFQEKVIAGGTRPGWGQGCCLACPCSPGLDRRLRCYPTHNLQADESSRVGPQDVGAHGQGDPGRREGHSGVRGRRDCRSAGRHAAAATSPRTAATASRVRLRLPPGLGRRRRRRRRSGPRGPGVPLAERAWPRALCTEPRPVTWAQVSTSPPRRSPGSPVQVRGALRLQGHQLAQALAITCCPCAKCPAGPTSPSHPTLTRASPSVPSWAGRQRL